MSIWGTLAGIAGSAIPGIGPIVGPMIGAGVSALGGAMGGNNNQWLQGLTTNQLNAADQAIGTSMDMYRSFADPFRDWSMGAMGQYGGMFNGGMDWMGNGLQGLQGTLNPDFYRNPYLTPGNMQDFSNMESIASRVDPMYDSLYGNVVGGGRTFDSNYLGQRYTDQIGQPDMAYSGAQGYLNNGGATQFNQPSVERWNDALNAGGWNPQMQGSYGFGGGLMQGALQNGGMNPFLSGLSGTGQGVMGMGQGLIGQGLGMANANQSTPGLQAAQQTGRDLMGAAMGGGMTPEAQGLNQYGSALMNRALGGAQEAQSPYAAMQAGQGNNLLGMAQSGQGMTQGLDQIMGMGSQLFNQAGGNGGFISPQYQQAFDQAMRLAGGQGIDMSGIGGGGGAFGGTATAGQANASVDPAWLNTMKGKVGGLLNGTQSALMPMSQMLSFAKDSAGDSARAGYQAAQRNAALRGGASGSVTGAGFNDPMLEFADEISQKEAQAVREAALQRQQLGLQEQGQALGAGGQISGEETGRYNTAANLAAQNAQAQTQASIASANNATQASVANANANTAAAQARAALLGQQMSAGANLLGNVLGTSSQNFLGGTNNALNQMNQAQQTAAGRYGTELQTGMQGVLGAGGTQNQAQANLNNRYGTEIGAGMGGLQQYADTALRGRLGGIDAATQLTLTPEQIMANRYGTSANLAGNVIGTGMQGVLGGGGMMTDAQRIASQNRNSDMGIGAGLQTSTMNLAPGMINAYNNAGQIGLNDMISRGQLGTGLYNAYSNNQNNLRTGYQNLLGQEQNYGLNSGQLINSFMTGQGNIMNNLAGLRLQGNQLGMNAANSYANNQLGVYNAYGNNYVNPAMNMTQFGVGNLGNMANMWGQQYGGLNQARMRIGTGATAQPSPMSQFLGGVGSAISQVPFGGGEYGGYGSRSNRSWGSFDPYGGQDMGFEPGGYAGGNYGNYNQNTNYNF